MLFVIRGVDAPGKASVRAAHRRDHLEGIRELGPDVKLAGPLLSDDGVHMVGSLLVVDFTDRAAAEAFVQKDPYVRAGLFSEISVQPFRVVVGRE